MIKNRETGTLGASRELSARLADLEDVREAREKLCRGRSLDHARFSTGTNGRGKHINFRTIEEIEEVLDVLIRIRERRAESAAVDVEEAIRRLLADRYDPPAPS